MRLTRSGDPLAMMVIAVLIALLVLPGRALAQGSEGPLSGDPAEAAEQTDVTEPAEPVKMARLRFLIGHQHGAADTYVDGDPVVEGLGFGEISDYREVPAGKRLLETVGQGMSLDEVRGSYDSGVYPNVAEAMTNLKPNRSYTAVVNSVDTGAEFKIVEDKAKPKAGQGQARVVSMCWACGPMSYSIDGVKKPIAKYLHYPEDKLAGKYVKVKTGEVDLVPRLAGAKGALTDFEPFTIEPGTSNSFFVVGQDASFVALVPAVDAALSNVRFVNASRDPTDLDVWVDGKKATARLHTGHAAVKGFNVLSGEHLVQVTETGTKPADGTLHEATVMFPPGSVAVEVGAGESLEAVASPSSLAPRSGATMIRFAHIDPEIGPVNIEMDSLDTEESIDAVEDLAVGESTEYIALPGGAVHLRVLAADDPAGIYHEVPMSFGPGEHITAYLGGSAAIPTVDFGYSTDPYLKAKKKKKKK